MRRLARIAAILTLSLLIPWLGGLAWFVGSSLAIRSEPAAATDAIVVLTGGKQRLEAGIALLAAGKAKKLFISGVNPRVERDQLLRALGPAAERETCCIVLGREAENTLENAHETAGWMRGEGYGSLRLVTGWYHMRRSLLEFTRAMPGTTIIAQPVFATSGGQEGWWERRGAAALIVEEYGKYLWATLRPMLGVFLPTPASPPAIQAAARRDAGMGAPR